MNDKIIMLVRLNFAMRINNHTVYRILKSLEKYKDT